MLAVMFLYSNRYSNKIPSSIFNSSALIHLLYHLLSTMGPTCQDFFLFFPFSTLSIRWLTFFPCLPLRRRRRPGPGRGGGSTEWRPSSRATARRRSDDARDGSSSGRRSPAPRAEAAAWLDSRSSGGAAAFRRA